VSIPQATPAAVNVPVYVNGQQLNSTASSSSTSLDEAVFAQLLQAMTAWQASPSDDDTSIFAGSQVQIWNA
jgi:hypothetical protein